MSRYLHYRVDDLHGGRRVWSLLKHQMGLSGTVIRRIKWLEDGVLLDGVRVNTDRRAAAGQLLSARVDDPEVRSGLLPRPGPLELAYEDPDLVVVNKAAGVPVHPGPGHFDDTLGNFLLEHYRAEGVSADFHPVHRLDRGTSGLLVVAKHPHAQDVLRRQLHTPEFRRGYLALCLGAPQPPEGVVDAPIGPAEGSLMARQVRPDGQPARTRYRTLARAGSLSLVELELDTGRTHQIRVHMAWLGCPLAGDFLYGREDPELIPRTALHSARLAFRHPISGQTLSFTAPLPQDMARLLPEGAASP